MSELEEGDGVDGKRVDASILEFRVRQLLLVAVDKYGTVTYFKLKVPYTYLSYLKVSDAGLTRISVVSSEFSRSRSRQQL